jgi:hypothetical protein
VRCGCGKPYLRSHVRNRSRETPVNPANRVAETVCPPLFTLSIPCESCHVAP